MLDNEAIKILFSQELIRFIIETYDLVFVFTEDILELYDEFSFITADGIETEFIGSRQIGEISVLWKRIGMRVKEADLGEDLCVSFNDGSRLTARCKRGSLTGRLQSLDGRSGEDF